MDEKGRYIFFPAGAQKRLISIYAQGSQKKIFGHARYEELSQIGLLREMADQRLSFWIGKGKKRLELQQLKL